MTKALMEGKKRKGKKANLFKGDSNFDKIIHLYYIIK